MKIIVTGWLMQFKLLINHEHYCFWVIDTIWTFYKTLKLLWITISLGVPNFGRVYFVLFSVHMTHVDKPKWHGKLFLVGGYKIWTDFGVSLFWWYTLAQAEESGVFGRIFFPFQRPVGEEATL